MREPILGCNPARLPISDGGIVNYGVEASERIHLRGDLAGLRDARQIADYNALGPLNRSHGLLAALFITSVQNDTVSLLNQKARCHLPKAICGTGNEHSRHRLCQAL
jgi:hypothetical protein